MNDETKQFVLTMLLALVGVGELIAIGFAIGALS